MGKDKVFLHISDETFIERLVRCGKKYFDRIIISTDTAEHAAEIKKILSKDASPEPFILTDLYQMKGPLGAIISIFEQTDIEKFAVIPVDVPKANLELLSRLYDGEFQGLEQKPVRFFCDTTGKMEPLAGVYTRAVAGQLKESLTKGIHKILRAVEGQYETVEIEEGFFDNINTPKEYDNLLK